MATKSELQDQASELGLEFTTRTTKAELEALIADAESTPREEPDPNRLCPVCHKVWNHIHR